MDEIKINEFAFDSDTCGALPLPIGIQNFLNEALPARQATSISATVRFAGRSAIPRGEKPASLAARCSTEAQALLHKPLSYYIYIYCNVYT